MCHLGFFLGGLRPFCERRENVTASSTCHWAKDRRKVLLASAVSEIRFEITHDLRLHFSPFPSQPLMTAVRIFSTKPSGVCNLDRIVSNPLVPLTIVVESRNVGNTRNKGHNATVEET